MYAKVRSLCGWHPVIIAGDTNIYMHAATNPATQPEHSRSGWKACGFKRATAGRLEDTLHTFRVSIFFRLTLRVLLMDPPIVQAIR